LFNQALSVLSTADAEFENLAIKLTGTVGLFQVISMKPGKESVRRALLRASSAVSSMNRKAFHAKPHRKSEVAHIPAIRKAKKLAPMTRPWLRGVEYA
jgi:hypothetical protein